MFEDNGEFIALEYPAINKDKYWKLTGKGKSIETYEQIEGPIKLVPFDGFQDSYYHARISVDNDELLPNNCNPMPMYLGGSNLIDIDKVYDVYIDDASNKIWAIAQDASGNVIFKNDNTAQRYVYRTVDLDSSNLNLRSQEKIQKGYRKLNKAQQFCMRTFNFIDVKI